jgi:hypothetical protein
MTLTLSSQPHVSILRGHSARVVADSFLLSLLVAATGHLSVSATRPRFSVDASFRPLARAAPRSLYGSTNAASRSFADAELQGAR